MYKVVAFFGNGEQEFVAKYDNESDATKKAKEAEPWYNDYGGTARVVKA